MRYISKITLYAAIALIIVSMVAISFPAEAAGVGGGMGGHAGGMGFSGGSMGAGRIGGIGGMGTGSFTGRGFDGGFNRGIGVRGGDFDRGFGFGGRGFNNGFGFNNFGIGGFGGWGYPWGGWGINSVCPWWDPYCLNTLGYGNGVVY